MNIMLEVPKTYRFEKCSYNRLMREISVHDGDLLSELKPTESLVRNEIKHGECLLIHYENNIIGYISYIPFKKFFKEISDQYELALVKNDKGNIDEELFQKIRLSFFKVYAIDSMTNPSHNTLYISVFEVFKQYRSFNNIKVVFNYIKKYCIQNNYDFVTCHAKNKSLARLYQLAGFKLFLPFSNNDAYSEFINTNPPMYLIVDKLDYFDVTEKLKYRHKKQLYESIMGSVAKEVKKALNENVDLSLIPIDACMDDCDLYTGLPSYSEYKYFGDCVNTVDEDHMWDATQMYYFINGCKIIDPKYTKDIFAKLTDGDRELVSSGFGVVYDIEEEGKIEDLSEIACAIDDYQKILVIYISRKDKHYFFDCIIQ